MNIGVYFKVISNLNMDEADLTWIPFNTEKYLPLVQSLIQADASVFTFNPVNHNYAPKRLASFRTALGLNNSVRHNHIAALVIQIETTAANENFARFTMQNMVHRGMIAQQGGALISINNLEQSVQQNNMQCIQYNAPNTLQRIENALPNIQINVQHIQTNMQHMQTDVQKIQTDVHNIQASLQIIQNMLNIIAHHLQVPGY